MLSLFDPPFLCLFPVKFTEVHLSCGEQLVDGSYFRSGIVSEKALRHPFRIPRLLRHMHMLWGFWLNHDIHHYKIGNIGLHAHKKQGDAILLSCMWHPLGWLCCHSELTVLSASFSAECIQQCSSWCLFITRFHSIWNLTTLGRAVL